VPSVAEEDGEYGSAEEVSRRVAQLRRQMKDLAAKLEFERAAAVRDEISRLQQLELDLRGASPPDPPSGQAG
jgi:protein-arginine kinase activator protein McsA